LSIFYNPELKRVDYLPPSLEIIAADRQAVIEEDFRDLKHLQKMIIFGDKLT